MCLIRTPNYRKYTKQRITDFHTWESLYDPSRYSNQLNGSHGEYTNTDDVKGVKLSPCAEKYKLAVMDPWNPNATGACVPALETASTQKVKVTGSFTAAVGTVGLGFVAVSPSAAADVESIFYSSSAFTGNSATYLDTTTSGGRLTGVSAASFSTPYGAGDLSATSAVTGMSTEVVAHRLVSLGIRARYTGTTLNESGSYYCLYNRDGQGVYGATTTLLGQRAECDLSTIRKGVACDLIVYPVNGMQTTLNIEQRVQGFTGSDLQRAELFPLNPYPPVSTCTNLQRAAPVGVILFTGVAGNEVTFDYVAHFEFAGGKAANLASANVADPIGLSLVSSALQMLPQEKMSTGSHKSALQKSLNVAFQGLSMVSNNLVQYTPPPVQIAYKSKLAKEVSRVAKKKIRKMVSKKSKK